MPPEIEIDTEDGPKDSYTQRLVGNLLGKILRVFGIKNATITVGDPEKKKNPPEESAPPKGGSSGSSRGGMGEWTFIEGPLKGYEGLKRLMEYKDMYKSPERESSHTPRYCGCSICKGIKSGKLKESKVLTNRRARYILTLKK